MPDATNIAEQRTKIILVKNICITRKKLFGEVLPFFRNMDGEKIVVFRETAFNAEGGRGGYSPKEANLLVDEIVRGLGPDTISTFGAYVANRNGGIGNNCLFVAGDGVRKRVSKMTMTNGDANFLGIKNDSELLRHTIEAWKKHAEKNGFHISVEHGGQKFNMVLCRDVQFFDSKGGITVVPADGLRNSVIHDLSISREDGKARLFIVNDETMEVGPAVCIPGLKQEDGKVHLFNGKGNRKEEMHERFDIDRFRIYTFWSLDAKMLEKIENQWKIELDSIEF